ncbi:DNA topoisomerase [Amorphus sp. 3PC139-8]|uniref:DNA topoisomerase n=1 Tax=Amorphus sp. 3PC139-8 TaxID=2735676 RepID=UPI00345DB72A
MPSVVICEKPSQARNIKAAIGDRYGPVLPAAGHIVRLKLPEEENPDWGRWTIDLLHPGRFYGKVPVKEAHARAALDRIRAALGRADQVIIATDCDREGQVIGQEILEFLGFRGHVQRAMFTAEDPKTLQAAFSSLRPNSDFAGMYASGVAREQADQITNLSLTRAATVTLRPPGAKGAIGIGRVKTPTLAIVCRREIEIRSFVPRDYFEVRATVATSGGPAVLTCTHLPQALRGEQSKDGIDQSDQGQDEADQEALPDALADPLSGRITDKSVADRLSAAAASHRGPLSVVQSDKRQSPPKLYHLPALQAATSARFGWSASHTLAVAQSLYEQHQVLTYPRAEARYLPENAIADTGPLATALGSLPQYAAHAALVAPPQVRKGKSGHFSDKALAGLSHHAIVPNVNIADRLAQAVGRLDADEMKLFDLVARSYLAALAPDYRYRQTRLSIAVSFSNHAWEFAVTGSVPQDLGWRAILGRTEDDTAELPHAKHEEIVRVTDTAVDGKKTKPPARYTEGSLIIAMEQAWRFVTDPKQRAVLKDARGIGTPATRDSIIAGLFKQGQLEKKAKQIHPTDAGLQLFKLIDQSIPAIADPGRTALWETLFAGVEKGQLEAQDAVRKLSDEAARAIARLVETAKANNLQISAGGSTRKPSEKQLNFAKMLSERYGIELPAAARRNAAVLNDWITKHAPAADADGNRPPLPPSQKLSAYAEQLSAALNMPIPEDARTDSKKLSSWIEQHRTQAPPSPKQLEYAEQLSEQTGKPLPDSARNNRQGLSKWIDAVKSAAPALPPTEKQLALAIQIAGDRGIDLPDIVRQSRKECSSFIDSNMQGPSSRKKTRRPSGRK